jgi:serine phosphatase RsbU (regulator of sigma subunit)
MFNLIVIYTLIDEYESKKERNILTRIGQVLSLLAINIVVLAIFKVFGNSGFDTINDMIIPINYKTLIFSNITTYILIILSLYIFVVIKIFIFSYRKPKITKYSVILCILIFLDALLAYFISMESYNILIVPIDVGIVIFMFAISFKLPWIMYLTKKEKYNAIISLFFIFAIATIYFSTIRSGKDFLMYTCPFMVGLLTTLLVFIIIYSLVSFITIIFHLPTQDIFDRKIVEISSLHNLSRLSTQSFDIKELIEEITKLTLTVCEASCAWIETSSDEKSSKFTVVGSANISFDEIKLLYLMEKKIYSNKMLVDKKMIYMDNLSYKPLEKKLRSLVAFSLTSHSEIIGILYIGKDQPFGFDKEYFNIISTFANQVSISIENAKLIKKSLEKERMERELLLAQKIQKSLLPQKFPEHTNLDIFANTIPAYEVGGDFYDFTYLSEDKIGIIVGDVSGKGISAAFYMALIKGMFKSLNKIYESPADLLKNINKSLYENIEKNSFVSLIYAVVDLSNGKLLLARGGHCPMILISDNDIKFIKPQGIGVGLEKGDLFDKSLEEIEIDLKRNSSCIFYTDGINEARNKFGEEFGTQRLFDSAMKHSNLNASDIANNIILDIKQFTGYEKEYDDLTLVVFKWK